MNLSTSCLLAFRTTRSAAPPFLHLRLQLYSPLFCSVLCYFCCPLRSPFPLWQRGHQSIHSKHFTVSNSVSYNPSQDSDFVSCGAKTSKNHV